MGAFSGCFHANLNGVELQRNSPRVAATDWLTFVIESVVAVTDLGSLFDPARRPVVAVAVVTVSGAKAS